MTPLAGTWLGYCMLGVAALIALYLFFSVARPVSSNAAEINSIGQSDIGKLSTAKFVLVIPIILLFFMAAIWSYYGGLPALREHSYPATSIQLDFVGSTERKPYWQVDQPISVNQRIGNYGNQIARNVRWTTKIAVRFAPISDALEEEIFGTLTPVESFHPSDFGIGHAEWNTLSSLKPLSSRDVRDLKDSRLFLFVLGQISYEDERGNHTVEYCRILQPPEDNDPFGIWALCHTHNRTL